MTAKDQHKWDLPTEMAVYINSHCQTFLPKKDLFDFIMLKNPVSSNVDIPQVMSPYTSGNAITPLMSKAKA